MRDHFKRKKPIWNESYFINVPKTSTSKRDIYWVVLALGDCGTAKSIPVLAKTPRMEKPSRFQMEINRK